MLAARAGRRHHKTPTPLQSSDTNLHPILGTTQSLCTRRVKHDPAQRSTTADRASITSAPQQAPPSAASLVCIEAGAAELQARIRCVCMQVTQKMTFLFHCNWFAMYNQAPAGCYLCRRHNSGRRRARQALGAAGNRDSGALVSCLLQRHHAASPRMHAVPRHRLHQRLANTIPTRCYLPPQAEASRRRAQRAGAAADSSAAGQPRQRPRLQDLQREGLRARGAARLQGVQGPDKGQRVRRRRPS